MYSNNIYFRIYSNFFFSLMLVCLGLSCGLKVGEKPQQVKIAEVSGTSCLSRSIDDLKLFFDGTAEDSQVDLAFQCLSEVLVSFKKNVSGSQKQAFTAQEMAYFIEKNFLKGERHFSSSFLSEMMIFKTVLVGGTPEFFKKTEIQNLADAIDRLRPELVNLNPEMKVILGKKDYTGLDAAEKEKQFQNTKIKAVKFFLQLSQELSRYGKTYEVENLFNFIQEAAVFAGAEEKTIQEVQKAKPFLVHFKRHLVGEGSTIRPEDWAKMSTSLHEFLFQYLRIKYFLDPLTEDQEIERWGVYQNMAQDMTQLMSTLLQTQKKPQLTNDQLYDLISSLLPLFTDKQISSDMIDSIADIKRALVGNSSDREKWTPSDIEAIQQKIPVLFTQIRVILNVLNKIEDEKKQSLLTYENFNLYEKQMNQAVLEISQVFDGPYDLQSLRGLILSLDKNKFLGSFQLPEKFEEYYKAVVAAKYALMGTPGSLVQNLELRHLLKIFGRVYFHWTEYSYFLEKFKYQQSEFLIGIQNILPKVRTTLDMTVRFKPSQAIETVELIELFKTVKEQKLWDTTLSVDAVKNVLEVLWDSVLVRPENRLQGKKINGLNSEALDVLQEELQMVLQLGLDINDIFSSDKVLEQSQLVERINIKKTMSTQPLQVAALEQLQRVLTDTVPLVHDSKKYLKIFETDTKYSQDDVFKSLTAVTGARLIIRSSAQDLARVQGLVGVTFDEIQNLYNRIKQFFFDLDMISPENKTFINSRYREANLFIAHANGDDYGNFEEIHDLLIHIFSGLERAQALKTEISKTCLPPSAAPLKAETAIDEVCLLSLYYQTSIGFESMPEFLQMKSMFLEDQNKTYYYSLLKAAGHIPNTQKTVLYDDIKLFPHVVQYIEVIFAKYDINKDRFLDKAEALKAFPVFKNIIKDVLKNISGGSLIAEDKYPGVFLYFLKFGKAPKTISEKLQFMAFINDEAKWDVQASRLNIGAVFNFIADATAPKP